MGKVSDIEDYIKARVQQQLHRAEIIREAAGSPKGGRVHWLLMYLSIYVCDNYELSYDYLFHRYFLSRRTSSIKMKNMDFFIIVRTSKQCFRLMYHSLVSKEIYYKSFKTAEACAEYINQKAELYELQTEYDGRK